MTIRYAEYSNQEGARLGALPSHWSEQRLMKLADVWTSNVDKHAVEGEAEVRLCNYTDVYKNAEITNDMDFMVATAFAEQIERFHLKPNDTLFTKDSETADDIGIPAFVRSSAPDLVCGYHLALARPTGTTDPRFLYWALASGATLRQWEVLATGVTRVGLRSTDLARVAIAVPPDEEQRQIADWLDRETAKIDVLVARQEALITTLRERRANLIARAVTQGLDPDAHLTESGVPWLGTVPTTWEVVPLKRVGAATIGLTYSPEDITDDPNDGTLVLRAGNIQSGGITLKDNVYVQTPVPPELRLRRGDILICSRNGSPRLIGKNARIPPALEGQTWAAFMTVFRSPMNPYVHWILNSSIFHQQLGLFATSTINQLTVGALNNLKVAIPPADEQQTIIVYLSSQTAKIDSLITKAEQFVALAKERRAAVVTAAVTGRMDVRDHPCLKGAA